MLQDTVNRALVVSQNMGVRTLLVHSLHDRAKSFYEETGPEIGATAPFTSYKPPVSDCMCCSSDPKG